MNSIDTHSRQGDPVIDRSERTGNVGLLIILAFVLVAAAGAFAVMSAYMSREQVEPYVLALLGVLAVIGVFSLFAGAIGLIRFAGRSQNMGLAKQFMDSMTEGVVVVDGEGRIVYANQAYGDMVGAEAARDVRSVERVFSGEANVAELVYHLGQAASEGRMAQEDVRLVHPLSPHGNGPRWYRLRVRPLTLEGDEGKKLTVWRVADITGDRDEQETSFQELQRAINFLDHAPAGFLSADAQGRLLYLNATLADWLGYDLARFEQGAITLGSVVRGDDIVLLDAISGEPGEVKTEILDLDFVKRNGQSLPVRLIHRVPFGADGTAGDSRTLVLNRSPGEDISESLRAAEVRFARFFNSTPIAIASVDREGRLGGTNAPFLKLFGQLAEREAGAAPGKLVDVVAEDKQAELALALQAAADGQGEIPPVDATLAGDKNRSARFYVSAVKDGEGEDNADAAIVYALETTEQRALEAQFAQSQKMQAVGQLAGGVAHDFNNMLTAIIGFSDLLLANHRPSDPAFQDIMNIKQNATRAAGLVRQLLAFSRRQTLRPQVLELGEVLSDLSVLLDRLLGEKVSLKVVHGRDLWPIMADLNQFEQVVINLAVNARDAMPKGGTLTVRTRNVTTEEAAAMDFKGLVPAEYVLLDVEDKGTGMSEEVLEKIFEPFFSTKDVGKGTGLGLSTVYGIVKQTGGFIYPQSVVGEGTTFHIFLPRQIQDEKAEVKKSVEQVSLSDLTGDATILLVEDEEAVRAFAARALASRGYTVLEASSGTEALEVLAEAEGPVNLVVSDVVMPEMDGPSLLVELRKTQPDLKIIFVSGYAEDAFKKNLPENEKFHFLPKPFTLKQLATAVKETLAEDE